MFLPALMVDRALEQVLKSTTGKILQQVVVRPMGGGGVCARVCVH